MRIAITKLAIVEPIFTVTLLLSAALLFSVEPMFAKMILPRLGGSAAVWSVAIAFFQTVLLLGYLYAHLSTRYLSFVGGVVTHALVFSLAFLLLPIAVSPAFHEPPPGREDVWLIGLFGASVGLPFFVVSATAPLMQAWFARTGHKNAQNPYILYGASNVGSFAALLAYPFVVEPMLTLRQQSHIWSIGLIALFVLIAGCAKTAYRSHAVASDRASESAAPGPSLRDRASWTFFAFVPSALMVAVTTHIGTEVVSAPFLWVIPLALYLATFVLVFRAREIRALAVLVRLQPAVTAAGAIFMLPALFPPLLSLAINLVAFFVAAIVCHSALYRSRPSASHLTSFYLYMSVGGALGGIFAALVAPHLFKTVTEYPILLVLALLARPKAFAAPVAGWRKEVLPILAVGAAALAPSLLFHADLGAHAELLFRLGVVALLALVPLQAARPIRVFALVAFLFVLVRVYEPRAGHVVYARSFYGVHKVLDVDGGRARMLMHGTTVHGAERLVGDDGVAVSGRPERLTYYYQGGPLDEALSAARAQAGGRLPRVALVGLGVGAMTCARLPGEDWRVFEIDPELVRLSVHSGLFRTMPTCAPDVPIALGDARLTLTKETSLFDVIVLDAYSSDNVPVHLLTKEAMALYRSRLSPHGVILMNISNRNIELAEVVAASAAAAHLTMVSKRDPLGQPLDKAFHLPAEIAALAREPADLGALDAAHGWRPAISNPGFVTWTDDYSNVLGAVLKRWL